MKRLSLIFAVALLFPAVASAGRSDLTASQVTLETSSTTSTLNWTTSQPATASVAYGIDDSALYARESGAPTVAHHLVLNGLAPSSSYHFTLTASSGKRKLTQSGTFTTAALQPATSAERRGTALLVNGQPMFPVLQWAQCPSEFDRSIALGVNVFLAYCPGADGAEAAAAAAGKAYVVEPDGEGSGPWQIGWHLPDEADGHGVNPDSLPGLPGNGHVSFLTVTTHFASIAAPISPTISKDIYPRYFAHADVIGFDLYPLGEGCKLDNTKLADVWTMQHDLVKMTGKPNYQWIETSAIEGDCLGKSAPITADAIRAESFLAIAGGATGLGYFTHSWYKHYWDMFDVSAPIASAISETTRTVRALQPALLSDQFDVPTPAGSTVRAGGRSYQGAQYVIAVNSERTATTTALGLSKKLVGPHKTLQVYGEQRTVKTNSNGVIIDHFAPLAVHIYVAAPAGS